MKQSATSESREETTIRRKRSKQEVHLLRRTSELTGVWSRDRLELERWNTRQNYSSRLRAPDAHQPLVFLDTNVIVGYLPGEATAVQLFSAEASGRIRFAVNPIVLQELLLAEDATSNPEFEHIRDHLRVLPADYAKAEGLLGKVRALRNRIAHSNDILIFSSADDCDFLVTRDAAMKRLSTADKPQVVTPEELVTQLRAA